MSKKSDISATEEITSLKHFTKKIHNMPFPKKLWIAASNKANSFINFNTKGTIIMIKPNEMDTYLQSPKSVFKAKNFNDFMIYMEMHGFYVWYQAKNGYLEYRHKYFRSLKSLVMCRNHCAQLKQTEKLKECKLCILVKKRDMENDSVPDIAKNASEKQTDIELKPPTEQCEISADVAVEGKPKYIGFYGNAGQQYLDAFFEGRGDSTNCNETETIQYDKNENKPKIKKRKLVVKENEEDFDDPPEITKGMEEDVDDPPEITKGMEDDGDDPLEITKEMEIDVDDPLEIIRK